MILLDLGRNGVDMNKINLKCNNISAVINYHGAELRSLVKDGKEYMWQADPAFWNRTSPVLFPFVGAVSNGLYKYDGKEYKMGQHGFARDMDFELVKSDDSSCYFELSSNAETKEKYPFDFKLGIGYELSDDGIKVMWDVTNTGEKDLEFSIGAHPAFNCILNKTFIRISKNETPLNEYTNSVFGKGLLTHEKAKVTLDNGIMKLDENSFDHDAFVIENEQTDKVEILDEKGNKVLGVSFDSPLVGIWSPPGKNAPFLCIEPWYGRADKEGFDGELKDREWNNTLEVGKKFSCSYTIEV